MKNLKKVLALGLALVMILGMFTIASAAETKKVATDLSDFDQVTHKEAVSLMVDLGVIKGLPDGSYGPANTIDRASWAKMVYFIITNDDDASVYIPSEGNVFADVPNNHWAAGEIAYLKTLGIVAGDGVNFRPSDTITMVEAYKMMLTGIGWNAKREKYEGDANWANNVMRDATRYELTDKLTGLKQGDKLTRDNAARIVYNALDCAVKEAQWKDFGSIGMVEDGYKTGGTLAYENFKIAKYVLRVSAVDEKGVATLTDGKMTNVKASATDVGRRVQIWANVTKDINGNYQYNSAKSSFAFPAEDKATKTVTGGIADLTKVFTSTDKDNYCGFPANSVETTGDNDVITWRTSVRIVMDGVPSYWASDLAATDDVYKEAAKAGNVVDFYDDDGDGDIDVITITTWKPYKVSGDVKTRNDGDGNLTVNVPGVYSGYELAERVTGYTAVNNGDVVLVNKSFIGANADVPVYTIEAAKSVAGKVAGKNNDGEITVDGTKYKMSGTVTSVADCSDFSAWNEWSNEYSFYLDKDGKICYAVVTEEGVDTSKVAMVLESLFVTGGDLDVANNMRVKLLFVDGTTENVTVTKVNGLTITADGAGEKEVAAEDALKDVEKVMFYNYKTDKDGKYELTAMTASTPANEKDKWAANKTEPGNKDIGKDPKFAEGFNSDNKTLFLVAKTDKDGKNPVYSTYTGFDNVPKMNAADVAIITAATEKDAGASKYVFIQTKAFADDKPSGLVYLRDGKYSYTSTDESYSINIVDANGSPTTLKVADDFTIDNVTAVTTWQEGCLDELDLTLYSIDTVTDGIVQKMSRVTADGKKIVRVNNGETLKVANGVVTLGEADQTYKVTDATVMVWIDLKSENKTDKVTNAVYNTCGVFSASEGISTGSVNEAGVNVEYPSGYYAIALISDGTAEFIYVVRDASAAA